MTDAKTTSFDCLPQHEQHQQQQKEKEKEVLLLHLNNEAKILDRIMYKSKNQHQSSPVYHRLQGIMRVVKKILINNTTETPAISNTELFKKGKQLSQKSFLLLRETHLADLTFIPFTITVMSLVSRLHYLFSSLIDV